MTDSPPDSLRRLSDPRLHDRLGFRQTTIRKLVKMGVLQGVVVHGVLRVPDSAVDQFVADAKRGGLD